MITKPNFSSRGGRVTIPCYRFISTMGVVQYLAALLLLSAPAQADESSEVELGSRISESLARSTDLEYLSHDLDRVTYTSCMPCHGREGEGMRSIFAPSLAGQKRWYLERQLDNFQKGVRGIHADDVHGAAMRPFALLLRDKAVRERVLDEIEALPVPDPQPLTTEDYNVETGQKRYEMSCALCHGDRAEGNKKEGAPRLNTLPAWYTARQLRNFQVGIRGAHGDDTLGQEMRPMAMVVYDEAEILDVAAFIATLLDSEEDAP